jgi:proteic killer suppression protein
MIRSAADRRTAKFLGGERIKEFESFARQAQRRIDILEQATCIEDLMMLPSDRFEALSGDRRGRFSIRINDRWRICFRFVEGDVHDVEIVDYHR